MAFQAKGVKRTGSQFRASVSELRSCVNGEVGLGFHFLFPSSPVTWCLTSSETMRLIRDGEKGGGGVWRWAEREITYLLLHCHHQNDFCIKVGSDESHFNVS